MRLGVTDRHEQEGSLIDVEGFGEEMASLANSFESCCYWIDDLLDRKIEAAQKGAGGRAGNA